MTITLKPQTEAKLVEKARQEGQDVETLVNRILEHYFEMQEMEEE